MAEITDLVSKYVRLYQSRRLLKGACPFHPDLSLSFMVNPEKQIFKCFGCGIEGNAEDFAKAIGLSTTS